MRYLSELSQAECRSIGEQAQARVLAEHTSEQRAIEFEREVQRSLYSQTLPDKSQFVSA